MIPETTLSETADTDETETSPLSPLPKPPGRPGKARRGVLPRPDYCLNCWERTGGNFCPNCGQENEDETVALKLLAADFLADMASFDSRLFRTLIPLLFRPGFLTNQYNAGRRVRYLSPFKLYLTMSVLFFVLLPVLNHNPFQVNLNPSAANKKSGNFLNFRGHRYDLADPSHALEEYNARQRDPRVPHDSRPVQYLFRQLIKVQQSPQSAADALLDYIPKAIFVLLPCFALSLKLVYLHSRRLYIEHLIFALHLHAFFFLLLSLLLVIHAPPFVPAALLALFVYPFVAMRVVYKQSWLKTALKYSLLGVNYLLLLVLTLLLAVAAAFLMM